MLGRLLEDFRPQIVHAHSWLLYSLLPLALAPDQTRCLGPRLRLHLPQGHLCLPERRRVHGSELREVRSLCNGAVRCAEVAGAHHRTDGYEALARPCGSLRRRQPATARHRQRLVGHGNAAMEVIPPFVTDEAFHADKGERPAFVPSEGDYLMFAGALGPHKGLDVLLEAWAGLQPKIPLVLVGIRRPDTPRSIPTWRYRRREMPAPGCAPRLGPLPRRLSPVGAGQTLWHGGHGGDGGRPAGSRLGGGRIRLVVDGTTGILVPPGDAAALRRAIQRLLADPLLRARMGAEGRQRAAAYSANVVVAAWERVFREVIARQAVDGVLR